MISINVNLEFYKFQGTTFVFHKRPRKQISEKMQPSHLEWFQKTNLFPSSRALSSSKKDSARPQLSQDMLILHSNKEKMIYSSHKPNYAKKLKQIYWKSHEPFSDHEDEFNPTNSDLDASKKERKENVEIKRLNWEDNNKCKLTNFQVAVDEKRVDFHESPLKESHFIQSSDKLA